MRSARQRKTKSTGHHYYVKSENQQSKTIVTRSGDGQIGEMLVQGKFACRRGIGPRDLTHSIVMIANNTALCTQCC